MPLVAEMFEHRALLCYDCYGPLSVCLCGRWNCARCNEEVGIVCTYCEDDLMMLDEC
jgi:hypothetical protein